MKRRTDHPRVTSPRLRGEVARRSPQGKGGRVRGRNRESEPVEMPAHPIPLPALAAAKPKRLRFGEAGSGEREPRGARIGRRAFIALLGGAAASPLAWPHAAYAQQPMPVVGFLRSTSRVPFENLETAFRQGLKETGLIEGQNVAIEYRYADNKQDRLPALAADLVRRPVNLIVGNTVSALAAKAATATVPIVFVTAADAVRDGLVTSLNQPGGNLTGVSLLSAELGTKRLDLLRRLVPRATTMAVLVDPNSPYTDAERSDVLSAAQAIRQQLVMRDASSERDIEAAFATFVQRGAGALLVGSGPFMNANRKRIVALAARHALPASYIFREAAAIGGLMSYGPSQGEGYRQAGTYAGRILKGEKPSDLPVMQSVKFELVFNLRTARTLGLDIPPALLALADEVIE